MTAEQLVSLSDERLAEVDPLIVNLLIAKGIPSLEDLNLHRYQKQVNSWAYDFATRYLPYWETVYEREPEYYDHNHQLFQVGMIAQYLHHEIGITYHEDQKEAVSILYFNPADLFLNGVLDTLKGTCGNMAAMNVAIAWRMGWPVSLACVHSHFLVRHDDGENVFNVEATCIGAGGFCWTDDSTEVKLNNIVPLALESGSDLKALSPRERLGAFLGLRARHYRDLFFWNNDREYLHIAEREYLLARYLCPAHRYQSRWLDILSALTATEKFDPHEAGHPETCQQSLGEIREMLNGTHPCQQPIPLPEQPGGSVFIRRSESQVRLATHDDVFESLGST